MMLAGILTHAEESLGQSLPRIAGAIFLLLVGLGIAWLVGRIVTRTLAAIGLDELSERFGITAVLRRTGLGRPLSGLLGSAVRIAVTVIVIIASVSLLGLSALSGSLNQIVLFLPKLFVALVLVIVGIVVADFVRDRVDEVADRLAIDGPIGRISQLAVLLLVALTALAQLQVPTGLLTVLVAILIVAAASTVALAFGLGGRDVARQLSSSRYISGSFQLGQTIKVAGIRGEIVALEPISTLLKGDGGETIRIPNHLLIESIVSIEEPTSAPTSSPGTP